jgi:hypothetical protein
MPKQDNTGQRLQFGKAVDHFFLAAITAAAIFAAHSINDLNQKVAVVIEHLTFTDRRADAQDVRIEKLEHGR